jgi:hypothetical protein
VERALNTPAAVGVEAVFNLVLVSLLTCPHCGHAEQFAMPTDACLWFHNCAACHTLLQPQPGDCCVFCSYGSVPCPPIQLERWSIDPVKNKL